MIEQFAEAPTDERTSEFRIRTAPMAKAFFAITAAALVLAAIFNFTIAGHRSSLIAEQAHKKAQRAEQAEQRREAMAARKRLAEAKPHPFPVTGSVQWRQVYAPGTRTTLFTVTDLTQNGRNKVISIYDLASNVHVANLYLQANTKGYVSLPTTIYKLVLTEGDQWLGPVLDFGPKAEKQQIGEINLLQQRDIALRFAEK